MLGKNKFVIEERPESQVYTTDTGFIGIRQVLRGEETVILFTVDETVKIIKYLQNCVDNLSKKG